MGRAQSTSGAIKRHRHEHKHVPELGHPRRCRYQEPQIWSRLCSKPQGSKQGTMCLMCYPFFQQNTIGLHHDTMAQSLLLDSNDALPHVPIAPLMFTFHFHSFPIHADSMPIHARLSSSSHFLVVSTTSISQHGPTAAESEPGQQSNWHALCRHELQKATPWSCPVTCKARPSAGGAPTNSSSCPGMLAQPRLLSCRTRY
jgi:hypothetical protein